MPRLNFVKHARKDNRVAKKGESYYWWKFAFGPKMFSKDRPRRSQLTQSEFRAQQWDIEDEIEALNPGPGLQGQVEEIASNIRALGEEQEEKKYNMPDGLQEGDTGILLEERNQYCSEWADELEAVELDDPEEDREQIEAEIREDVEADHDDDGPKPSKNEINAEVEERVTEAFELHWEEKLEEVHNCQYQGE